MSYKQKNPQAATVSTQRLTAFSSWRSWNGFKRFLIQLLRCGGLRPFKWNHPIVGGAFEQFESCMPLVSVIDRDEDVLVRAEVSGVGRKVLDISMSNNVLTLKGSIAGESKEVRGMHCYRCEVSSWFFSYSVSLTSKVNIAQACATMKDDVLEIVLPKAEVSSRKAIPAQ